MRKRFTLSPDDWKMCEICRLGVVLLVFFTLISRLTKCDQILDNQQLANRYKGFSLLRLSKLSGMTQIETILSLREKYEDNDDNDRKLIIFNDIILSRRLSVRLLTSPDLRPLVERHLASDGIEYEVVIEDLSLTLRSDLELNSLQHLKFYWNLNNKNNALSPPPPPPPPNHYMRYDETVELLTNWTKTGDNRDQISLFSLGQTYEGRDTKGITINGDRTDLPAIWIDSGIDPSNWLSPATALYVAHKLINSDDDSSMKLRSRFRWFIVPVVNPDGYEHSFVADRFWRKTRRSFTAGNRTCFGADLNKNFDVHWGGAGTTDDPCTSRFRGPEPFSEVEAVNLRKALEGTKVAGANDSLFAYLSIQSHGQFIFCPFTGKDMMKPKDYDYLFSAGKAALEASKTVEEIETEFRFGTPPDLRYPTKGSVLDWVKETLKVNWTYVIDVFPASESVQVPLGHVVSPVMIRPSGEQTYRIVETLVENMRSDFDIDLLLLYHGIRGNATKKADAVREEL